MERPQAILFDVDGLLITTGGAGGRSWRWAFNELYGIPADIGKFTDEGMTDPVVGRLTFTSVIGRQPSDEELARVISHYLMRLPEEVASSSGYRVLDGVEALLPRLGKAGFLLGSTTRRACSCSAIPRRTSPQPTLRVRSASGSRVGITGKTSCARPARTTCW